MIRLLTLPDTMHGRKHGLPDGLCALTVMNQSRMITVLKSMVNTYVQDAWKTYTEGMWMTV